MERSPMFSDGRYIYIISLWAKEKSINGQDGDEDNEEDQEENSRDEKIPARYGVDIYDPLDRFNHVKGVELKYS
jgi:hypothetical protein